MKPLLDVTHLSISYGSLTAVNDLSFSLNAGSTLAIVGESGSGKSSVLRAILGLPERGRSWQGDISMDGQSLLTLPPGKRRALCGSAIAMIFQDAGASFCPIRRISAQISESIRAHANWTKQQIRQRAEELMAVLDLPQTVWDAYPFELSGGMGQRVGILAAMMLRPKLLLADEPTSACHRAFDPCACRSGAGRPCCNTCRKRAGFRAAGPGRPAQRCRAPQCLPA